MRNVAPLSCHRMTNGNIEVQWVMGDNMITALYKIDAGKYTLNKIKAPWAKVRRPGKDPRNWSLRYNEAYKKERAFIADQALMILECLNTDHIASNFLKQHFKGPVIGFDEYPLVPVRDWPVETFDPEEEDDEL